MDAGGAADASPAMNQVQVHFCSKHMSAKISQDCQTDPKCKSSKSYCKDCLQLTLEPRCNQQRGQVKRRQLDTEVQ